MDLSNPELSFALEAVSEALRVARGVQGTADARELEKKDRSPVTVADFSIQALFAKRLKERFPEDPLVAEESAEELRRDAGREILSQVSSWVGRFATVRHAEEVCDWIDWGRGSTGGRFWTLDPIDGTKGFLRGGHYAVGLALVVEGRVSLGVMGCPHWGFDRIWQPNGPGSLVFAKPGEGAWCLPAEDRAHLLRLRVSRQDEPSKARILRSYESGHTNEGKMELLIQDLQAQADPVRMDSQAKYAVLAAGQGDLLVRLLRREKPDYREKIWDQAAGAVVVEEAGGRITDLDGRPLRFDAGRTLLHNRGIVASNGRLHEACLESLRKLDP